MVKKKLKLAYIPNDSMRKATFRKRKRGLVKKVYELSTLCGIDACAIVYSPFDSIPEVWPSNSDARRVISEFKTLSEMDQQKKMVDNESFTRQRILKAFDHHKRERKEGREMEMTEVMFQSLIGNMGMFRMNIMDLNDLGYLIDQYIKDLNRRSEILLSSGMEIGQSSNVVAASFEGTRPMANVVRSIAPTTTITEVGRSLSSAGATTFFNSTHHQQQLHQQTSLYAGVCEQHQDRNLNLHHNQPRQQGFMEINHSQQMGFPFLYGNYHQQQIPSNSSALATISSDDIFQPTIPNHVGNVWFR